MEILKYHPEFVTATIYNWYPIVKEEKFKKILIESLQYLVHNNRIILYSYCIMDTHIHLIWQVRGNWLSSQVRRDLFRFTAHQFKRELEKNSPKELIHFKSTQSDRTYQFWERNTLCIDVYADKVFNQKMDYIHNNPLEAGMCKLPEEYTFSSAMYYLTGYDRFNMLSHANG